MVGRGTRGYVAVDCESGAFMWLKDAWRAYCILADPEGNALRKLNDAEIINVPTLICHGDIGDQVTLTPDWWEVKNTSTAQTSSSTQRDKLPTPSPSTSSPLLSIHVRSHNLKRKRGDERSTDKGPVHQVDLREECPLRRHKHYRLVVKEVARPLTDFKNGCQLISLVSDCVYGEYLTA